MQQIATNLDPGAWIAPLNQLAAAMTEVSNGSKTQGDFDKLLREVSEARGLKEINSLDDLRGKLLLNGIYVRLTKQENNTYRPELAQVERIELSQRQIESSIGELAKLAKLNLPSNPEIYAITKIFLRAPFGTLPVGPADTVVDTEPTLREFVLLDRAEINRQKVEWPSPEREAHVLANELTHLAIHKTFPNLQNQWKAMAKSPEMPFPVQIKQIEEAYSDLGSMMRGEPIGIVISRAATVNREHDYGFSAYLINSTYNQFFSDKQKELSSKKTLSPAETRMLAVIEGALRGVKKMKEGNVPEERSTREMNIFLMQESRKLPLLNMELSKAVIATFKKYLIPLRDAFALAESVATEKQR